MYGLYKCRILFYLSERTTGLCGAISVTEYKGAIDLSIEDKKAFLINTAYFAAVAALAFLSLKVLSGPAFPFAAALVLTVSLQRFIKGFSKRLKLQKKAASLAVLTAVYVLVGGLLALICYVLYRQLISIVAMLPEYADGIIENIDGLSVRYGEFKDRLPVKLAGMFEGFPSAAIETVTKKAAEKAAGAATAVASGVPYFVLSVGVMIIASAYFAKDYDEICAWAKRYIPKKAADSIHFAKNAILSNFYKMFRGYFLIMLITFLELFVGLSVLKLKYALVTAALISVIDILPVLGSGTVLIPWAVFCALSGNMRLATGLTVMYLIITAIRNYIEPKIIGNRVGVHPLIMLATAFAGLKLFGAGGILLLPIFAVIVKSWLESKGSLQKSAENADCVKQNRIILGGAKIKSRKKRFHKRND